MAAAVPTEMATILVAQLAAVAGARALLTPRVQEAGAPLAEASAKELCEKWFLAYAAAVWIPCFAAIVGLELYLSWGKWHYMAVCAGLAAPLLLQPVLAPSLTGEAGVGLLERYSLKANIWIAVYSFLGNYWGTQYFYSILGCRYTLPFLPSHQLNGVPVCMYFATHFYFCFYHALANKAYRWVLHGYQKDAWRTAFLVVWTLALSYVVAFLETFSIAAFPYYTFADRGKVYTVGSAFYALYLIVSFPMFWRLGGADGSRHSVLDTFLEAASTWMVIMSLLDAVRLWLGADFSMTG